MGLVLSLGHGEEESGGIHIYQDTFISLFLCPTVFLDRVPLLAESRVERVGWLLSTVR